jgi:acyl-CoA synthetase (AMP-forming)/AMP-acid ligase II
VIEVTDGGIASWTDARIVPDGQPGELVVRGPQVTREYAFDPNANEAAKISDGDEVWHRMGDVVRLVGERLWFLGRKSHRIETARGTLYPDGIENVFNVHRAVARSALVDAGPLGSPRPVLVVELAAGVRRSSALAAEILALRSGCAEASAVESVLFHHGLPVDPRHNAKIDRKSLALWALEHLP